MSGVDVLVVGLGPAGASAAVAAAAHRMNVLAIDRREEPGRPVQCAEFVPGMLDQMLGFLDSVTSQRVARMVTYVDNQVPDMTPDFRGRMIDRAAFDAGLVRHAIRAGATCRFGVVLKDLSAEGQAALTDGTRVGARVVIGADGPRSRVGQAIGRINTALVETRQIRVALLRRHDATDIYLSAGIPGGYGWLFPRGGEANLGIGAAQSARSRLKPMLEALHRRLCKEGRVGAEVLGLTGGAIPVGGMVPPVGSIGVLPVLLAGDAAGLANPVTGAGIASAVQSGQLAGRAAADWCRGHRPALEEYVSELEEIFGPALARACRRRSELLQHHAAGTLDGQVLRRGWIAYPEYWAA